MKTLLVFSLGILLMVFAKPTVDEGPVFDNALFSQAVYNELTKNAGNFVVSPFSVQAILALTEAGAVGSTAEELRNGLFLQNSDEQIRDTFRTILPLLQSQDFALNTANKVYVQEAFPIKDNFRQVAIQDFQASFQNVDFGQKAVAEEINEWVRDETNGKIQDIVNADELDEGTRLVLINALYLQGNWTHPFQPKNTQKKSFHTSDKGVIETDMMLMESALLNFYESKELDAKFLELPFAEDAALIVLLPNQVQGLPEQPSFFPEFQREFVRVELPKFRIETSIDFRGVLEGLGIRQAFSADLADFSNISGNKGDLFIGRVNQKSFIDVSELGLEAAAATVVGEPMTIPPEPTQRFVADRPFLFYVKVKDVVLFEGRVLVPEY